MKLVTIISFSLIKALEVEVNNDYPSHSVVVYHYNQMKCGGVIIGINSVLTIGSCVSGNIDISKYSVQINFMNRKSILTELMFAVSKIHSSDEFISNTINKNNISQPNNQKYTTKNYSLVILICKNRFPLPIKILRYDEVGLSYQANRFGILFGWLNLPKKQHHIFNFKYNITPLEYKEGDLENDSIVFNQEIFGSGLDKAGYSAMLSKGSPLITIDKPSGKLVVVGLLYRAHLVIGDPLPMGFIRIKPFHEWIHRVLMG